MGVLEIRSKAGAERHCRQARTRRAAVARGRRARCSSIPICSRWPRSPTASASGGTAISTYYNYNIRIEATNVCVASCLFCSFARLRPGDPGSYTMSLEDAWEKLRVRARSAAHRSARRQRAASRICRSTTTSSCCAGFKRIRPEIHLKCFTAVEIAFFADLYGMTDEQVLRELMDAGLASLPGGGAEVFAERVRRKICHDKADADRWLSIHRTAHRLGHEVERDDALRPHRDERRARRSHAARPRAAGRDRRLPGVHPAGVPSRQQPDAQAAGADRIGHAARARRVAADARQHPAREGVLDCDRRGAGADGAVVRRRRSRRDRAGRKDLPHGRIAHARGADDRATSSASSARPAACPSSATRSTTSCRLAAASPPGSASA